MAMSSTTKFEIAGVIIGLTAAAGLFIYQAHKEGEVKRTNDALIHRAETVMSNLVTANHTNPSLGKMALRTSIAARVAICRLPNQQLNEMLVTAWEQEAAMLISCGL